MTTVENGVVSDVMTMDAVADRVGKIQAAIGGKAYVNLSIACSYHQDQYAALSISPFDVMSQEDRQRFTGSTWQEVFSKADAWLATYATVRRDGIIRKMALDIIDLTDMEGSCSLRSLMRRGHHRDDVLSLSEAACVRASEMSSNAPFSVLDMKDPRA